MSELRINIVMLFLFFNRWQKQIPKGAPSVEDQARQAAEIAKGQEFFQIQLVVFIPARGAWEKGWLTALRAPGAALSESERAGFERNPGQP
ncbi:MAG: hypothetical protein VKK04_25565 [Synechococcales bacterium]|nr:hypothetical protein [Synechococcales bacterium]